MSIVSHQDFHFTSKDGLKVACTCWHNRRPPRGILQIAHGMGEHIGRYSRLIEELVQAGLVVYGSDHRGHGHTALSPEQLGDFGSGGFDLLVEDMVRLSVIAKEENPGQPLILLGHSMGSFAAQQYALEHSDAIAGLVLSGTGALDELARIFHSAQPGENILNARFEPARTRFDWLSRDPAVADAFIIDPLCFEALQPASMESFLAASTQLAQPRRLSGIRADLPIYLFSGSDDPVGQQLKGVQVVIDRYRRAGLWNVAHQFYPGGRHEMLNEMNANEVRTNLLLWISSILHW
jgi:alpha-beta hydrolase superfamily lysophospholipase